MSRNTTKTPANQTIVTNNAEAANQAIAGAAIQAQVQAWKAANLTDQQIAVLLSDEAKKLRKKVRHATVTSLMTRERFAEKAESIKVQINGVPMTAFTKYENPDKSFGWMINDKMKVTVDGVLLDCQLGLNITVIGSKPVKQ